MITPDGSVTGVAADEPRNSNRGLGRHRCQDPNRTDHHLAAKNEDWAMEMVADALYKNNLTIVRNRGNYPNARSTVENGRKANAASR